MTKTLNLSQKRIESIDILRGIVMVLMALDHVRDYFHITGNTDDPLNLDTTTPALFFTRWITHLCAPIFIFLSGVSIYLQSLRKTKKELSIFVIKRGLWLIFMEWTIIAFAWTFNPAFNFVPFQVIWAIGISMVILGFLILLPYALVAAIGFIIVFGHNLLDITESAPGFKPTFWMDLLHSARFAMYPFAENHAIAIAYPFLPWTGLMILGYCAGIFFSPTFDAAKRRRILTFSGLGLILLFIVLRFINMYGDPEPYTAQKTGLLTFFSFMKVNKYPPSLMYMSITIGIALVVLAFLERFKNAFNNAMSIFGRTAFFYYILHIYLIHFLSAICFFARGHSFSDGIQAQGNFPFLFCVPGEGFGLPVTYLFWILTVVILYPLCKWYDRYKTSHKEKWWLSYL